MSKREERNNEIERKISVEVGRRHEEKLKNSKEYKKAVEEKYRKEAEITKKYDPNFNGEYADEYLEQEHATVYEIPADMSVEEGNKINDIVSSLEEEGHYVIHRPGKENEPDKMFVLDEFGTKIKNELQETEEAKREEQIWSDTYNEVKDEVRKEYAKELYQNQSLFKRATDKMKQVISSQDTNQSGKGM